MEQRAIEFEKIVAVFKWAPPRCERLRTKMSETTLKNVHDSLVANVEPDKVLVVLEQISLGVKDAVKIIDAQLRCLPSFA